MAQSGFGKFPARFGKYILLDRINSGGMAEVFRGKVTGVQEFQRLVAIKCMLPALLKDELFVTMFIDEAKLSSQLSHANIVQIYELGSIEDRLYIAMELISGRDLRHVLKVAKRKKVKLPFAFAAYAIGKAAEGLGFAHTATGLQGEPLNIVHRDVSPQNIMMSYDGEAKVMDFGIAKAEERATETQAGVLKGKFAYMAPEQVMGQPVDGRADIFALGAVLYECLTYEKLFHGESDLSILDKVRGAKVPDFNVKIPDAPDELLEALQRALARDPDDRFARASDFAEALEPLLIEDRKIFGAKKAREIMHELFEHEITDLEDRNKRYVAVTEADCGEDDGEPVEAKTQIFESTFGPGDLADLVPARNATVPLDAGKTDGTQANVEMDVRVPAPKIAKAGGGSARPRIPTGDGSMGGGADQPRMPGGDGGLDEGAGRPRMPGGEGPSQDTIPGEGFFEDFQAPTVEMDASMAPLPPTALGEGISGLELPEGAPTVVPKPIVFGSILLALLMLGLLALVVFDPFSESVQGWAPPEGGTAVTEVAEIVEGEIVEVQQEGATAEETPTPSPTPAPDPGATPEAGTQPEGQPAPTEGQPEQAPAPAQEQPQPAPQTTPQPQPRPQPQPQQAQPPAPVKKQFGFVSLRVIGSRNFKVKIGKRTYTKDFGALRVALGTHNLKVIDDGAGKTGTTRVTVTARDTKKKPKLVRVLMKR